MPKWYSINGPFRKRQQPLIDAMHFLQAAMEIIKRLQSNPHHEPDEGDFIMLKKIEGETQDIRLRVMHIHHCFLQRLLGKPEPPFL